MTYGILMKLAGHAVTKVGILESKVVNPDKRKTVEQFTM